MKGGVLCFRGRLFWGRLLLKRKEGVGEAGGVAFVRGWGAGQGG